MNIRYPIYEGVYRILTFEEACRTYCVKLFDSGCAQIDRREDGTACAGVYA